MNISQVKFVYGDGVKTEEYGAIRKAEAHLTADVPEGASGEFYLGELAKIAIAKVNETLGKKVAPAPPPPKAPADAAVMPKAPNDKERMAAEAGVVAPVKGRAKKTEPVDDVELLMSTAPEIQPDDLSDIMGGTAVADKITDADLLSTVGQVNGATKNRDAIRALVQKFKPDGLDRNIQVSEIPVEKRHDFIAELKQIKPKA